MAVRRVKKQSLDDIFADKGLIFVIARDQLVLRSVANRLLVWIFHQLLFSMLLMC